MSKLLKLKDWLTVEDAAKHLSLLFGEVVTTADILRLALDGQLTLSVNFVNGAYARCGPLVTSDEATYTEFPADLEAAMQAKAPGDYKGAYMQIPNGVPLKTGHVIELGKKIVSLRGIYDLPMIGSERHNVEHSYQELTGGPAVTLQGLYGAFVLADDGSYCQLQEDYEENEYQLGSEASGRKLEALIARGELNAQEAESRRAKFKADRDSYKKLRVEQDRAEHYFPAGGIPDDCILTVRTHALLELHEKASKSNRSLSELGTRERHTLLKLIIGLAIKGYGYKPGASRNSAISEIAADLASMDIAVGDDTVREWLQRAAKEVLPASQQE